MLNGEDPDGASDQVDHQQHDPDREEINAI